MNNFVNVIFVYPLSHEFLFNAHAQKTIWIVMCDEIGLDMKVINLLNECKSMIEETSVSIAVDWSDAEPVWKQIYWRVFGVGCS